jgi:hypothetical protein
MRTGAKCCAAVPEGGFQGRNRACQLVTVTTSGLRRRPAVPQVPEIEHGSRQAVPNVTPRRLLSGRNSQMRGPMRGSWGRGTANDRARRRQRHRDRVRQLCRRNMLHLRMAVMSWVPCDGAANNMPAPEQVTRRKVCADGETRRPIFTRASRARYPSGNRDLSFRVRQQPVPQRGTGWVPVLFATNSSIRAPQKRAKSAGKR